MPEETDQESSDANVEGESRGRPRVGAAFAGETTGSFSERPEPDEEFGAGVGPDDETIVAPAGGASNEVIGDYEILGKLGQGGMGAVYRARQISLNRQVALKVLPTNMEADSEFVARFQREARMAASLNHRNIVKVYASGLVDGCHFIAMELIEGETLAQFVRRGALEPTDALRITRDVALALQCGWNTAHLIHRDIKPGNIFLSENGEVKVGDLGLAKSLANDTTGLTQTGTAMGTPHYISPEQSRGDKDIDFRADIYSLGCTLYQMLTGRTPYSGSDAVAVMSMHRDAPPPAILKVLPQTPIPLARLVGKMLKKIKRERQGSYEELIAEIEKVQALYAPAEETSLSTILPPDPDATMLQAPVPNSTRSRVPTVPTMALPRAKSKLPLYGGIAAALVVAGIAFVVLRPKVPEKLTKAEIAMREREAAEKAKPAAAPSSAPVGMPAAIRLTDTVDNISLQSGVSWENGVLHMEKHGQSFIGARGRDGIVRASVRSDSKSLQIALRFRKAQESGKYVSYALVLRPEKQEVDLTYQDGGRLESLKSWPLPRSVGANDWVRIELRIVGEEMTVSFNGTVLGTARDGRIPGEGIVDLWSAGSSDFRDVEYVPLDGSATAQGNANSGWQPLFSKVEWEATGDRHEFREGLVHIIDFGIMIKSLPSPNGALRARIHFREGTSVALVARATRGVNNYKFQIYDGGKALGIWYYPPVSGSTGERLASYTLPVPLLLGDDFTLEFRLDGEKLSGVFNGAVVVEAVDGRIKGRGEWGITAKEGWFESVECRPLESGAITQAKQGAEWRPLFTSAEWQSPGDRREYKDGFVHLKDYGAWTRKMATSDGALRARMQYREGTSGALAARSIPGRGNYKLSVFDGKALILNYSSPADHGQAETIGTYALPTRLQPGENYTLEFRLEGSKLTGLFNGTAVLEVAEDRIMDAGDWGIYAKDGWYESVEYSTAAAVSAPSVEAWQDLLKQGGLTFENGASRVADGVEFPNNGNSILRLAAADGAVRVRAAAGVRCTLRARLSVNRKSYYATGLVSKDRIRLNLIHEGPAKALGEWTIPPSLLAGDSHTIELRAVGSHISVLFNGQVIGESDDQTLADGSYAVGNTSGGPVVLNVIEFLPLAGTSKLPLHLP